MELCKVKIHRKQEIGSAVSQITLDDDYNVPDYRPDIVKVLKEKGELRFDEVKAGAGFVWVKGSLSFRVLYRSEQGNGKISCLKGELPFQEKLNVDGAKESDQIAAEGEIEDLTVGVINSRKLSIRAVAVLSVRAEEELDEELTARPQTEGEYEQKLVTREGMTLLAASRDVCRQKSETVLPSSKPNVREILWRSIELRNVESRIQDGKVLLDGEVLIAVLYSEEEETERLQWYETTVPLECGTDCGVEEEDVICKVKVTPVSMELEVKPDYDGEERILVLELALHVDIRVWREERLELLEDVYSLKKKLVPVYRERILEKLLVKNYAKSRIAEQIELPETQERILQICACEGKVSLERRMLVENGVQAEGSIVVELLYITTDDNMPVGTVREIYPFSQVIEIPDMEEPLELELDCGIEQLAAVMLDQEHIEIKAVVHLELLAILKQQVNNIEELEEEELDMEELQNRPGLIGYIAKEGDELWDIAKENHTTIRDILETNGWQEKELAKGDTVLIVKQVG